MGRRNTPPSVNSELPPLPLTQVPSIAKQPSARLMPLLKVEEAVVLKIFKRLALTPLVKVEVALPVIERKFPAKALAFTPPTKVEVAVEDATRSDPWIVEVAMEFMRKELETTKAEVEAVSVTASRVEVAWVEVEKAMVRLVMVEVALLTKTPPERVERLEMFKSLEPTMFSEKVPKPAETPASVEVPVTERVPAMVALFTALRKPTESPPEEAEPRVEVPVTVRRPPIDSFPERFRKPDWRPLE